MTVRRSSELSANDFANLQLPVALKLSHGACAAEDIYLRSWYS
jgi:hypothetical protein